MTQQLTTNYRSFGPKQYLNEYYSQVGDENKFLLNFFADCYKDFDDNSLSVLELGGGPAIYQLISMAPVAQKIFFTDYLKKNLRQVSDWQKSKSSAYDWSEFIRESLICENTNSIIVNSDILSREKLIKQKIIELSVCDVFKNPMTKYKQQFDVVSSCFVAESICKNKEEVLKLIRKIATKIKPGGYFVTAGLLGADSWHLRSDKYIAADLNSNDIKNMLRKSGFSLEIFRTIPAQNDKKSGEYQGYSGIFMVKAKLLA